MTLNEFTATVASLCQRSDMAAAMWIVISHVVCTSISV